MLQISFSFITCPAILAAYTGQAAYLRKFPEKVGNTFYESIPSKLMDHTHVEVHLITITKAQSINRFIIFMLS